MKILEFLNQNIPTWSIIKGDHACTDFSQFLNEKLILKPNFLSQKENSLRKQYLKSTKGRDWLYDYTNEKSFALISLERQDIEEALTVWKTDVGLLEVSKEYEKAYKNKTGFEFKNVSKPFSGVSDVFKRQREIEKINLNSKEWITKYNEEYDYHRTLWMKRRKDNKLVVVDGTHRCIATTWKYLINKSKMPTKWMAIYFEE